MFKITFKKVFALAAITLSLVGCQSTPLNPQAQRVIISPNAPPKGCHYVGEVTGNQGNFFTGGFTSNQNLEQGALNDIKNKAAALGANYVQTISNRAGVTGAQGGQQQTNVVYTGNGYFCKKLD